MSAWGRHLAKVSFFAMAVAVPRDAVADSYNHCPEIWSDYADLFSTIKTSADNEQMQTILFVGTGGEVYNCIEEQVEDSVLENVIAYERSLVSVFQGDFSTESENWSESVCKISFTSGGSLSYVAVRLPYLVPILTREDCQSRVGSLLDLLRINTRVQTLTAT